MLELNPELLDHLSRGGTLVVPTAQRATALRMAYAQVQLLAGRRVWSSPDVLSWSAWLERGLDDARIRGVPVPRRLSRAESWWLWGEAVRAACSDLPVLSPDTLIDSIRRAVLLLEDHAIAFDDPATPEAAVLLRAQAHFRRRCAELSAVWSSSWVACEPFLQPRSATRLVGFPPLGPGRRQWLARIGVATGGVAAGQNAALPPMWAAPGRALHVQEFATVEEEAAAAAQWCAAHLQRDPGARLLLVVMRLPEQRHHWLRALGQRLDYGLLLDPAAAAQVSAVAVEGGLPLHEYPLVACALRLLALAAGEADFDAFSAVLRSPYLPIAGREARLRIDVWLREHNIETTQHAALRTLIAALGTDRGSGTASALQEFVDALAGATTAPAPLPDRAQPAQWARQFALVLERCGWPGQSLGSHEQQIRTRFDELLGEFAALNVSRHTLPRSQALQLLRDLNARTAFEPASDDVPVTVTADLGDPIVRYDGIWVAGLTADVWPKVARPDPLIPWVVQQAAAMPLANPQEALRRAEQALRDWAAGSVNLILSWSRSEGDLHREPSALLHEIQRETPAAGLGVGAAPTSSAPGEFRLESWLAQCAPVLEAWRDDTGPAWPGAQPLSGGTHLLELQALCPFRGFAQLRLQAKPLPEPEPGIDAGLRGRILHRALERFWGATSDSVALRERSRTDSQQLIQQCVDQALNETLQRVAQTLEPALVRREAQRAVQLLAALVDWELTREPFAPSALEWPQQRVLAGATLRLRLDRIDRLADGSLIVIDYKTGAPESFDPLAQRLTQPQLPAYALVAGEQTAAVLALYLGPHGLKLRGVADRADRLSGLRPLPDGAGNWASLMQRWDQQLSGLVQEFVSGQARVQPQPGACKRCHLQALCRIDAAAMRA